MAWPSCGVTPVLPGDGLLHFHCSQQCGGAGPLFPLNLRGNRIVQHQWKEEKKKKKPGVNITKRKSGTSEVL